PSRGFQKIEFRNVVFRYLDKWSDAVFQVGPIDFTLQSGDLVFITGGNGSGKSTFMKLLCGLYKPDSVEITFDGVRVNDSTRQASGLSRVHSGHFSRLSFFQKPLWCPRSRSRRSR